MTKGLGSAARATVDSVADHETPGGSRPPREIEPSLLISPGDKGVHALISPKRTGPQGVPDAPNPLGLSFGGPWTCMRRRSPFQTQEHSGCPL